MKIAIMGTEPERIKELTDKVLAEWGVFPTPEKSIYDEDLEWVENNNFTKEECEEKLGESGAELYSRMMLLGNQYDQYKDVKNIIYRGCTLDLLANALFLVDQGDETIKPEAVDKLIYWNKRLIRKLDMIYILPPKKKEEPKEGEEPKELTDEEKENQRLEQIYFSLWLQYADNFEKSEIYPHDDCPGIVLFETEDPLAEMRMVIDSHGNLASDESPEDIQRLYSAIKDPRILKEAKKILEKRTIPLVGTPQTTTLIEP